MNLQTLVGGVLWLIFMVTADEIPFDCSYMNDEFGINYNSGRSVPTCDEYEAKNRFMEHFSTKDSVPWMVSLQDFRYETAHHFCSGIIISDYWILTTAFCVVNYNHTDFKVVAGDTDFTYLDGWEQIIHVKKIIMHEDASFQLQRHRETDVALIQLKSPLVFNNRVAVAPLNNASSTIPIQINTITMAPLNNTRQDLVGETCFSYGWGLVMRFQIMSPLLKKSNLTVILDNECRSIYYWTTVLEQKNSICAISNFEDGPCMGDWGGPLICNDQIVGMASWSNGCASPEYPVVFVDIFSFQSWIKKIIEDETQNLLES